MTRIGSQVEVQTQYTGVWVRGFTLAAVEQGGYLVRRESDGVVLPTMIPVDHIRPAG